MTLTHGCNTPWADAAQVRQGYILVPDWLIVTILSCDWLIVTILSSDWFRYSVKSANQETSSTLQPFYTLQLDIQVSLCYTLLARRHFDIQTYFFRVRTS